MTDLMSNDKTKIFVTCFTCNTIVAHMTCVTVTHCDSAAQKVQKCLRKLKI
jgi:hypothetical protein